MTANTVTLTQAWIDQNRNTTPANLSDRIQYQVENVAGFQSASIGVLRTLQVGQKTLKLLDECGVPTDSKELQGKLGTGIGALGLARVIPTGLSTFKAAKVVAEHDANDGVSLGRKIAILFREGTDMISAWIKAAAFVFKINPLVGVVGDVADAATDSADAGISFSDAYQAADLEAKATNDATKEVFTHTKHYNMIRVAKAVTAVVSGVLGLLMLVLGAPLVPAIVAIGISLASTILAIGRDLYKPQGNQKVFEFDRVEHLRAMQIA